MRRVPGVSGTGGRRRHRPARHPRRATSPAGGHTQRGRAPVLGRRSRRPPGLRCGGGGTHRGGRARPRRARRLHEGAGAGRGRALPDRQYESGRRRPLFPVRTPSATHSNMASPSLDAPCTRSMKVSTPRPILAQVRGARAGRRRRGQLAERVSRLPSVCCTCRPSVRCLHRSGRKCRTPSTAAEQVLE